MAKNIPYQIVADTMYARRESDCLFYIEQLENLPQGDLDVAEQFNRQEITWLMEAYQQMSLGSLRRVVPSHAGKPFCTWACSFGEELSGELSAMRAETFEPDEGRWGPALEYSWDETEQTELRLRNLAEGKSAALQVLLGAYQLVPHTSTSAGSWWFAARVLDRLLNQGFVRTRGIIRPARIRKAS